MPGFEGPPSTYPSKRDRWLEVVLWLANIAVLAAMAPVAATAGAPQRWIAAAAGVAGVAFVCWILYGTAYTLDRQNLVVRSGPFRWTIPLPSIDRVRRTRNPLAAPACSLDRLAIWYRRRAFPLLVSPADREGFLRDLRLRCPHLVERDGGLMRD